MELYSGPEFMIHYKHSFILNSIFVTMFFGPGIPILFPITWLTLSILYWVERLMLAYSYTKPPMYDVTINKSTIAMIAWSPLVYAFTAIWFFSNQQIFRNTVVPLGDYELFAKSGHTFSQLFTQITPATPFLFFIPLFACFVMNQKFNAITAETEEIEKSVVDQNL